MFRISCLHAEAFPRRNSNLRGGAEYPTPSKALLVKVLYMNCTLLIALQEVGNDAVTVLKRLHALAFNDNKKNDKAVKEDMLRIPKSGDTVKRSPTSSDLGL